MKQESISKRTILVAALVLVAGLQAGPMQAGSGINPDADDILKSMSSFLAGTKAFSVSVDIGNEVITNEGEKLHRIGDKVGTFTVAHIGYYESEHHDVFPRVWLTNAGSRCIVGMGAPEPSQTKPSVTTPKPTSPKNAAKEKIQNEVKSKIKKVGENQFEVDRSGVELIIKNYAKLAGSLRSRPTKEGMRVSGIKQDDILSELGMKTGDMLQSINGFDMTDPDKAVDAYAKLRKAGQLDIQLTRDGAPITIGVKINK